MTGSTQERSPFLAPTVKNNLFLIIPWRHMKMSTREENHLPVLFVTSHIHKVMQGIERHARIHIGENPFSCCKRDKAFLRIGQLKTHSMTHNKEKPFVYSECDKWFVQSSGLKTHQRIDEIEEPCPCTKCVMSFTQNRVLKTHERIHTGEKLFAWSKCDKSFSPNSPLRNMRCFTQGRIRKG